MYTFLPAASVAAAAVDDDVATGGGESDCAPLALAFFATDGVELESELLDDADSDARSPAVEAAVGLAAARGGGDVAAWSEGAEGCLTMTCDLRSCATTESRGPSVKRQRRHAANESAHAAAGTDDAGRRHRAVVKEIDRARHCGKALREPTATLRRQQPPAAPASEMLPLSVSSDRDEWRATDAGQIQWPCSLFVSHAPARNWSFVSIDAGFDDLVAGADVGADDASSLAGGATKTANGAARLLASATSATCAAKSCGHW